MTFATPTAPLTPEPVAATIPLDIPALPTDPFGSLDLPRADVPVSEWGIRQAHLRMLAYYKVPGTASERTAPQRPIGAQLDKALAIVLNPELWTIHPDHVEVVGSESRYRVTPEFCQGSTWSSAKGGKGSNICKGSMRAASGMCKHQLAVEYLRLAQALTTPIMALVPTDDPAPALAPAEIARAEILGSELFAILGRIRVKQRKVAEDDVELLLSADDQIVLVNSGGPSYGATSPATVSGGAMCALTPAEFADLWSAISSDAARDALSLTLAIQTDPSGVGLLAVTGPGINVAVACMAMPC